MSTFLKGVPPHWQFGSPTHISKANRDNSLALKYFSQILVKTHFCTLAMISYPGTVDSKEVQKNPFFPESWAGRLT